MSEHNFEDELEERDDVVEQAGKSPSSDGEPWAKTSSGDAEHMTSDDDED
jgi:hypothetical protein